MKKQSFLVYIFLLFLFVTIPLITFSPFYKEKDNFVHVKNLQQLEQAPDDSDIVLENDIDLSDWDGKPFNYKTVDGNGHKVYDSNEVYKNKPLFSNDLLKLSNITFENIHSTITQEVILEDHFLSSNDSISVAQMETWEESIVYKNITFKNNNYSLTKTLSSDYYYSPIISKVILSSFTSMVKYDSIYFASFRNINFVNNNINIDLDDNHFSHKDFYSSLFANFIFPSKGSSQSGDTHKFILNLNNISLVDNNVSFSSETLMTYNHYANLVSIDIYNLKGSPNYSGLTSYEIFLSNIIFENNAIDLEGNLSNFVYGEFIVSTKDNDFLFEFNDFRNIVLLNNLVTNGVNIIESDQDFYNLFNFRLSSDSIDLITNNLSTIFLVGINFAKERQVNFFINYRDSFQNVFKGMNLNQNDPEFDQLTQLLIDLYNPYVFDFVFNDDNNLKMIKIHDYNSVVIYSSSKAIGEKGKIKSLSLEISLLLDYKTGLLVGNRNSITLEKIKINNQSGSKTFFESTQQSIGKDSSNQFDLQLTSTNPDGWSPDSLEENLTLSFEFLSLDTRENVSLQIPLEVEQLSKIDLSGIYVVNTFSQIWFILLMTAIGLLFLFVILLLIYFLKKHISKNNYYDYENSYYDDSYDYAYDPSDYYNYSYENDLDDFDYYRGVTTNENYDSPQSYDENYDYQQSYNGEYDSYSFDEQNNQEDLIPDVNPNPTKRKIVLVEKVFPKPESKIITDQQHQAIDLNTSTQLNNSSEYINYLDNKVSEIDLVASEQNVYHQEDSVVKEPTKPSKSQAKTSKTKQPKINKKNTKKSHSDSSEEDEILSMYL